MPDVLNQRYERSQSSLIYDTRRLGDRLRDTFASEENVAMAMVGFAIAIFFFRQFAEMFFAFGVAFFFYARGVQRKAGLAMRMPKSSGEVDPKEISLKTKKPTGAEGIIYMGNDRETGEEVWITDGMARTHMLFMGTTGSGKTEYLVSLVFNALIHGSGLIYVDGKADSSLYGKIYSMARAMGRDDDVLVINFQTGAKDIYGAQPRKLSNTLNPFSVGSSGMLSELVKGLMATGEKSTWTQQAESFVEALMKPLVFLRDRHGLNLDVNVVREYFELNKLEDLAWRASEQYPDLTESGALDGLHAYLLNKPGYKKEKYHDQSETTHEQHGYITMQLGRTFNSLSDTYGYIMKTPLAEIDFVDVFLNRRILVVLLPALEKSPSELTNLGRIVVASIKATMAKGLGSAIEGDWDAIIESKPTTSPSPFMAVFDEYGYYSVEGFAVVPAQARSLGFSAIFAGQDLPAFEKGGKEEAASTLANTTTKLCGKLECKQTFEYFQAQGGEGLFTRQGRYETNPGSLGPTGFKAETNVSVEKISRVGLDALRGQISGEWHMFYGNTILRVQSFFANPKPVKKLRVNHFVKVARPTPDEVASFRKSNESFARAIKSEGGLKSFMDIASPVADIQDIERAISMFSKHEPLLGAGMVLAYCALSESRRAGEFAKLTGASFDEAEVGLPMEPNEAVQAALADARSPGFDFAGQMRNHAGISVPTSSAGGTAWGPQETAPWDSEPGAAGADDDEQLARAYGDADRIPRYQQPSDDPHGLYEGMPMDVGGSDQSHVAVAAHGGASVEGDFGYNDGYDSFSAAPAERLPMMGSRNESFADHTDLFGIDEELPDAIAFASNDIELNAKDMPTDPSDLGFPEGDLQFDEPAGDDGLLDREATVSGLAAIERAAGASEHESNVTAGIVAGDVGDATRYPMPAPRTQPDLKKFHNVANRVAELLGDDADTDD